MTEHAIRAVQLRETITKTGDGHSVQFAPDASGILFIVNGRPGDYIHEDHALVNIAKEALAGAVSVRDPSGVSDRPVRVFDHIWLLSLAGMASDMAAAQMRAAA